MAAWTPAQRIVIAVLAIFMMAWLCLSVAGPVLEYLHGPSPESALLQKLANIFPALLFVLAIFIVPVLRQIGVMPAVKNDPAQPGFASPTSRLRNLAFWIVIALLLVFLFNLFQGTGKRAAVSANVAPSNSSLMSLIINIFSLFLLVGVWVFFMYRAAAKKKKDLDIEQ